MSLNCALILAAGEGTRMKSSKPKVLAEVLFKPMISWVIDSARNGGIEDICVVTGHKHEMVEAFLGSECKTVLQEQRLGTGHAVMTARAFLEEHKYGNVLILNGDAPLMDSETISAALQTHLSKKNAVTVISAKIANPFGYGRIVRNKDGLLKKIVEEKEASALEKTITEVNSGAYWFNCDALLNALDGIVEKHDAKGENAKEYYLTDALEVMLEKGLNAEAFTAISPDVVLGANDRAQLQELNEIARRKIMRKHMLAGVSIPCADGVIIGPEVEIGADTEILPGTVIKGKTTIGTDCVIGPNGWIEDSTIQDNVTLNAVQCYSSIVRNGANIGPFSRIRPDCDIGEGVKAGNFVEFKNANIGTGTSIAHLSYIGDADFGAGINVGCGCATANYTGKTKHRTTVGDRAFIGCHNCLVAPVQIGENAYTAAGSVITEDVPDDAFAIARSRETIKKDWVTKKKPYRWQK